MKDVIKEKEGSRSYRKLLNIFSGMATSDGDGVKLTRIIGSPEIDMFDPFLMLDCFESDDSSDYVGGFPTHPHRGFETVTYLLNGRMRHKDNAGHEGVIEPGGVQWMTAGKGILHSEMPEQEEGLLKGYQLWINLPASAKMCEPAYQEYSASATPLELRDDGTEIRVIAGQTLQGTKGPVINNYTQPIYMDVKLPSDARFEQVLPAEHSGFVYVIEGDLVIAADVGGQQSGLQKNQLGVLSAGDGVIIEAGSQGARFLLLAAQPLNEPVARGGPFVMNTHDELVQAFDDYRQGLF